MSSSVNRQMLVLRGSLELTELVDNPHYVIIMELEYLVNWGSAEVNICVSVAPRRHVPSNDFMHIAHIQYRRQVLLCYCPLSSQAVGSTVVVIGWAVWQLFDKCYNQWQSSGLANVVLTLKAGPGYKPPIVPASAWNTCYRVCLCVCVCCVCVRVCVRTYVRMCVYVSLCSSVCAADVRVTDLIPYHLLMVWPPVSDCVVGVRVCLFVCEMLLCQ